jgi:rhodanese-related sulfurtransferase
VQRTPDYESITPRELKTKLEAGDRPELLDVREPWEFELTHSP